MSQATETLDQVRTQTGGFAVRGQTELEHRLWLILGQLPDAPDDCEDSFCGQLRGLFFALGVDWAGALQLAIELWDKSRQQQAPVAVPDPQCPVCRSWNIDEDEEHDPPGAYYRCRQCGERWVELSKDDIEYLLAQLESLEGRAVRPEPAERVVQPIEPPPIVACSRCAGCGQIADDKDGTPWKYWEELPVLSGYAVSHGLVRPIACPMCGGSGKLLFG